MANQEGEKKALSIPSPSVMQGNYLSRERATRPLDFYCTKSEKGVGKELVGRDFIPHRHSYLLSIWDGRG